MQQQSRIGLMVMAAIGALAVSANAAGLSAISKMRTAMAGHERAHSIQRSAGARHRTTLHKPNGARECARRRAQIARGILQVSP